MAGASCLAAKLRGFRFQLGSVRLMSCGSWAKYPCNGGVWSFETMKGSHFECQLTWVLTCIILYKCFSIPFAVCLKHMIGFTEMFCTSEQQQRSSSGITGDLKSPGSKSPQKIPKFSSQNDRQLRRMQRVSYQDVWLWFIYRVHRNWSCYHKVVHPCTASPIIIV